MAVVPTPPTFVDGPSSSSQMNQLRDVCNFLLNPPIATLYQSAVQSIPNGTHTALTFGAETFDTDVDLVGGHDNATNNSRYTVRYAGKYVVSGAVSFASNATGLRLASIKVNGEFAIGAAVTLPTLSGAACVVPTRTLALTLAAGDYVEINGYQTSGAALNTSVSAGEESTMSIYWLAA